MSGNKSWQNMCSSVLLCTPGIFSIAVIEDKVFPNRTGAYWGELNTSIHKALGLSGALTNGVMRDLADMAEGFPIVAGSLGPSHAFVHVLELRAPVKIFGFEVHEGDLVHAEQHGTVVIPIDTICGLTTGIDKLLASERIILNQIEKGVMNIETFEKL